jgi:hypothetical protein
LLLASALLGVAVGAPPVVYAATLTVVNNDGAGEGFNDPTPKAPVGGNTGTTLGAQRLIAFQHAADIWGGLVSSAVTIRVGATFDPLSCNASGAVLGSAGPTAVSRDFTGALVATTWYPVALATALHGSDLDPGGVDITAQFNSSLGTTCPFPKGWYYGLDGNAGSDIDFLTVLLHEMGHGLGFLTFVDSASGAKFLGFNDTFMLNLEDHGASPADYPSMTNAQRVAASKDTGNLHWVGAHVRAASGVLTAGKAGDHVQMFAPNPQQPGSSVSHWDTALTPNQLMEPSYTVPLDPVLDLPLLQDIGWTLLAPIFCCKDFNGDGKADILWRHTTGTVALWLMNGATITSNLGVATIPTAWTIDAVGDFNGDGKADILWRHTSGTVALWLMNGATIASNLGVATIPTDWTIAAVGDFNGDGKADILWRHTTGTVALWLMNGATIASNLGVATIPTAWTIAAVGDFNGDGKADILWRHTTGTVALWLMNGTTITSNLGVATIPTSWTIQ